MEESAPEPPEAWELEGPPPVLLPPAVALLLQLHDLALAPDEQHLLGDLLQVVILEQNRTGHKGASFHL